VMRGPFKEEFYQCVTFGAYTARWQEQLYSTVSLLLMYVIPLVTMVTAYLLIFSTIARKSHDFLQQGELWAGNMSAEYRKTRQPKLALIQRMYINSTLLLTDVLFVLRLVCSLNCSCILVLQQLLGNCYLNYRSHAIRFLIACVNIFNGALTRHLFI